MADFVQKSFGLGAKNNVLRVLRKIEGFMLKFLYPNITGEFIVYTRNAVNDNEAYGAFTESDGGGKGESYVYSNTRPKFSFNASASNSIYREVDSVQVYSLRVNSIVRI